MQIANAVDERIPNGFMLNILNQFLVDSEGEGGFQVLCFHRSGLRTGLVGQLTRPYLLLSRQLKLAASAATFIQWEVVKT